MCFETERQGVGIKRDGRGDLIFESIRRRVRVAVFDSYAKLRAAVTTATFANTSSLPGNASVPCRPHIGGRSFYGNTQTVVACRQENSSYFYVFLGARGKNSCYFYVFLGARREKKEKRLNRKTVPVENSPRSGVDLHGTRDAVGAGASAAPRRPRRNPGENRDTLTRGRCLRTRARPFVYWRSARPRRSGSRPPLRYARVRRLRVNAAPGPVKVTCGHDGKSRSKPDRATR